MAALALSGYDSVQQDQIQNRFIVPEGERSNFGVMQNRRVTLADSNNLPRHFHAGGDAEAVIKFIGILFVAAIGMCVFWAAVEAVAPIVITVCGYLFWIALAAIAVFGALYLLSEMCK